MRSALNTFLVAIITLYFCFAGYVAWLFDRTGDGVIRTAGAWARTVARATGMQIRVTSAAQLDPSRPYVFMANHVSAADIWALYAVLPVPVRMIAKKQLGSIPFFGWVMHAGRFIFIDRKNPARARDSLEEAARRIRAGHSVLLFPEGTRSRDGKLARLKKGGFHLAVSAGVPIVPIAIKGTYDLLPPDHFRLRPGQVEIQIGAPVPTEGLREEDRERLNQEVRSAIARMLGQD